MKNNWIKFSVFCCLTVIILSCLNFFVFVDVKYDNAYTYFYEQKENSLDLVCVGNSTVRRGINPCEAWNEYGVTSYNICSSPTHLEVILIAIDEIARTQNPKLVYIDLNGLTYQTIDSQNSFVKKYIQSMPNGEIKDQLLEKYDYAKEPEEKGLFKNHNNFRNDDWWKILFNGPSEYLKGFDPNYHIEEQEAFDYDKTKVIELPEDGKYYLNKILEKCKQYPSINFVFGKMPRFLNEDIVNETYMLRSAISTINDYGYTYIEWDKYIDEIGLNCKHDAYDQHHLNVYGSIKFTKFFIKYLDEHFSICGNNHSEDITKDYNAAFKKYEIKVKKKLKNFKD